MLKFMYPTPVGIANYNDNKTDFKSFIICIEGNRCFPNKNFGKDNYLSEVRQVPCTTCHDPF